MADKKKPPFYNDDSLGTFHYKQPFYETMELFIETLTGTCFELRVFPFDTVISVKAKIQRLEGIPIAQQHLIWNNLELDDEYSLHDYNITEGCTLKLVLAMRGGPINTRRVGMEEPVYSMANLMENSRTREVGSWENTLPGKPVTFLVYREGEQLNFFQVVDCENDTLTSFSGSPSDCSLVYNVFTEEEEDGDGSVTAAGIATLENSITMNKMKLLKAEIEDLSLNKKLLFRTQTGKPHPSSYFTVYSGHMLWPPKKFKKMKPQPPVDPHGVGRSVALPSMRQHHHRLLNVLPQINHSLQPNGQLPPIGGKEPKSPSPPSASTNVAHNFVTRQAPSIFSPSSCFMLPEEELQESEPLLPDTRPPPKVSSLCVGNYELMRDSVYPQLPLFSTKEQSEEASERHRHALSRGLVDEAARRINVPQPGAMFGSLKDPSEPQSLDVSPQTDGVSTGIGPLFEGVGTNPFFPLALADKTQFANTTLQIQLSSHSPSNPSTSSRPLPQAFEFTGSSSHPSPRICTRALLKSSIFSPHNSTSFTTPHPAQVQDIKKVSLSKYPEKTFKNKERGITKIANQTSKEPLGILSNLELASRGPRLTSRERLVPSASLGLSLAAANASGLGLLGSTASSVPENIKLLRKNFIKRMSPLRKTAASYQPCSSLGSAGGASSLRRLSTPSCYLPPVKVAVDSGKKNTKICFCCGKKTGLATSYECRCGNNFCATHRYAETHNCTYDYKSAGRRFLQKTNPIISAPKLPKI